MLALPTRLAGLLPYATRVLRTDERANLRCGPQSTKEPVEHLHDRQKTNGRLGENPGGSMNGMKLRRLPGPAVMSAVVVIASAVTSVAAFAQHAPAQQAPTQNAPAGHSSASMVKPPSEASGGENPDNMPVKKPRKPTNDKMMHFPPASAANAK
jgi:hypothetical protein